MAEYTIVPTTVPGAMSIMKISNYKVTYYIRGRVNEATKEFEEGMTTDCRDSFINSIKRRKLLVETTEEKDRGKLMDPLSAKTTVFGIFTTEYTREQMNEKLNLLLPLLNKFEKARRWRRTTIHNLKCRNKVKCTIRLVKGSRMWLSNPYFMYIYLGAFKVLFNYGKLTAPLQERLVKTKSLDEWFNVVQDVLGNRMYQYASASRWTQIIKDRGKIFKDFTENDLYYSKECIAKKQHTLLNSGIYSLTCRNKYFSDEVKKLTYIKNSKGVSLHNRMVIWRKGQKI